MKLCVYMIIQNKPRIKNKHTTCWICQNELCHTLYSNKQNEHGLIGWKAKQRKTEGDQEIDGASERERDRQTNTHRNKTREAEVVSLCVSVVGGVGVTSGEVSTDLLDETRGGKILLNTGQLSECFEISVDIFLEVERLGEWVMN